MRYATYQHCDLSVFVCKDIFLCLHNKLLMTTWQNKTTSVSNILSIINSYETMNHRHIICMACTNWAKLCNPSCICKQIVCTKHTNAYTTRPLFEKLHKELVLHFSSHDSALYLLLNALPLRYSHPVILQINIRTGKFLATATTLDFLNSSHRMANLLILKFRPPGRSYSSVNEPLDVVDMMKMTKWKRLLTVNYIQFLRINPHYRETLMSLLKVNK